MPDYISGIKLKISMDLKVKDKRGADYRKFISTRNSDY
jgi:hypothetical protein